MCASHGAAKTGRPSQPVPVTRRYPRSTVRHIHRLCLSILVLSAACGDDGGGGTDGPPGDDSNPDGPPGGGPTISAAEAVEALVTPGFTGGRGREADIAFSGTQYLVVWRDDRLGYSSDIFATRFNADGTFNDGAGIMIANTGSDETTPAVAWTGTQWLVAWMVDDDGIAAATVSDAGAVTALGAIANTAQVETNLDLAAGGSTALLVWQADEDVRGAVFSAGAFGAPFDIAASTTAAEANPAVAPSATNYLVAWQEGTMAEDLKAQIVTPTGTLSGSAITVSATTGAQIEPAGAFDGVNFVLAWKGATDVWGSRISPTGTVLDRTGPAIGGIEIFGSANLINGINLACDTTTCLFTWDERTDLINNTTGVYGQRRSIATFAAVGGVITVNDDLRHQAGPSVAPLAAGGWVEVWDDREVGIHNVSLTRIAATGAIQDPEGILVNNAMINSQRQGTFAVSPFGQLAVWTDSRSFGNDIMARRYDSSGATLDPSSRVVSDAVYEQNSPALASDSTQWLVTWSDARNATFDLFAARFSEAGTNLDPAGIPINVADRNQLAPDLASDGTVFMIAYSDLGPAPNLSDIAGAIVTGTGAVTLFDICRNPGLQQNATVTWDQAGGVFVVAWEDDRSGADFDVYAARVQPDGTVLDTCGVRIAGGAGDERFPAIESSGTQQLLVWEDSVGEPNGDIRGTRLTTGGALNVVDATPLMIGTGASPQRFPTVAPLDDGRWSVAWVDHTNEANAGSDIVGTEVTSAGASRYTPYVISAGTDWEFGPQLQAGPNGTGTTYIMYAAALPSLQVQTFRRQIVHPR